ncbi:MAG: riboflavin synthase [Actinomycetota bacterium]
MFTGIVEELGEVIAVTELPSDARRLEIAAPSVIVDSRLGDSIAVNGVCLTVAQRGDGTFAADVMRETLIRSSLRDVHPGTRVNLERPVTLATRLGGHLVQGHVDGTGTLLSRQHAEHWDVVRISLPAALARYVVEKGSIAVDGVSLTVVETGSDAQGHWFSVSLIPTTLEATTLGTREAGDVINLEVDVIAKYVERLAEFGVGA